VYFIVWRIYDETSEKNVDKSGPKCFDGFETVISWLYYFVFILSLTHGHTNIVGFIVTKLGTKLGFRR